MNVPVLLEGNGITDTRSGCYTIDQAKVIVCGVFKALFPDRHVWTRDISHVILRFPEGKVVMAPTAVGEPLRLQLDAFVREYRRTAAFDNASEVDKVGAHVADFEYAWEQGLIKVVGGFTQGRELKGDLTKGVPLFAKAERMLHPSCRSWRIEFFAGFNEDGSRVFRRDSLGNLEQLAMYHALRSKGLGAGDLGPGSTTMGEGVPAIYAPRTFVGHGDTMMQMRLWWFSILTALLADAQEGGPVVTLETLEG